MGKRNPALFDLVAVVNPPADSDVEIGDVGTVVELLPPDAVEVEFINPDGRTLAMAALQIADLLVLNRERTQVA
jgi:catabolite regulation protein CreA